MSQAATDRYPFQTLEEFVSAVREHQATAHCSHPEAVDAVFSLDALPPDIIANLAREGAVWVVRMFDHSVRTNTASRRRDLRALSQAERNRAFFARLVIDDTDGTRRSALSLSLDGWNAHLDYCRRQAKAYRSRVAAIKAITDVLHDSGAAQIADLPLDVQRRLEEQARLAWEGERS
jgi:hypothetical protein